jgi:hypothetical protein
VTSASTSHPSEKPKRHPSVRAKTLADGHVVLMSKAPDCAYTLSPIAGLVWEFCDGTNTIADIAANIRKIPEIDASSTLEQEIRQLLDQWKEWWLLEVKVSDD